MIENSEKAKEFINRYENLLKSYAEISEQAKSLLCERTSLLTKVQEDLQTKDEKIRAEIKHMSDRLTVILKQCRKVKKCYDELSKRNKKIISDIWDTELKASTLRIEKQAKNDILVCLLYGFQFIKNSSAIINQKTNVINQTLDLQFPEHLPEKYQQKNRDKRNNSLLKNVENRLFDKHYFNRTLFTVLEEHRKTNYDFLYPSQYNAELTLNVPDDNVPSVLSEINKIRPKLELLGVEFHFQGKIKLSDKISAALLEPNGRETVINKINTKKWKSKRAEWIMRQYAEGKATSIIMQEWNSLTTENRKKIDHKNFKKIKRPQTIYKVINANI